MDTFDGFPKRTLAFLRNVGKHNDKGWFHAHRAEYEAYYVEPAKRFVEVMGTRLGKVAPGLQAVPRVDGSIFRINRDVRFSAEKRPYKDYLDLWMWQGSDRGTGLSGFYMRLAPRSLTFAAGVREFSREQLARYRAAVGSPAGGRALSKVVAGLERTGYRIEGQRYKRVPLGFDPDHPCEALLRHDGLRAAITSSPVPAEAHSAALVRLALRHFAKLLPLHRWLVDHTRDNAGERESSSADTACDAPPVIVGSRPSPDQRDHAAWRRAFGG